MPSIVVRAIAALRTWLGFNDPDENHLHETHGWLLPLPAEARADRLRRTSPVEPAMVSPSSGKRQ